MKYKNLSTDELIEKIVEDIGIQLPYYSYIEKKYIIQIPHNISFNDGATGIEMEGHFDTFKEACIDIIEWGVNDS